MNPERVRRSGLAVVMGLLLCSAQLSGQQVLHLPREDEALEPVLDDLYRVGAVDGADWETFGNIGQVAFGGDGDLYVMDRLSAHVVVVDLQGNLVREFGHQGEGPGEWRAPGGMGVMSDGTVVISDAMHRAYMVYDAKGEYTHQVRMSEGGSVSLGQLFPDPRGGAVFNVSAGGAGGGSFSMQLGAATAEPSGRPIQRITLGEDGEVSTFYSAWRPPRDPASGGGPPIFEPRVHIAALPDGGLAVVDSSAYVVKLVGADGRERARVIRDIPPAPVTRSIEDAVKERVSERLRPRIDARGFYPEIPVVAGLGASPSGTLWVQRSTVDPEQDGPVDLFRPDGTYLGTIPGGGIGVPHAFGPDGLVAYVERDDLDVASIHVMRLPAELR